MENYVWVVFCYIYPDQDSQGCYHDLMKIFDSFEKANLFVNEQKKSDYNISMKSQFVIEKVIVN